MALPSGTRLGSYEVVAPLGAGGMGEVYRARDTRLDREVAVKVLPPHLAASAEALARFEREAKAVAALSHPNILAIHDFGTEDGTAFAVMELLEGETLRERLTNVGAFPVHKTVEYALQIAHGLAAAHARGIVHRDLKPENVFVTRDGHVKILDFGLARQALVRPGDDLSSPTMTRQTDPGTVLGTAGYMSPEQVRGQAADHRSDIFSFGAILYEMTTGRRAFQRDTSVETMTAILREDLPEPTGASGTMPPGLDRVVRHCLEKSPDERFQSARDLAFDLQAAVTASSAGPGSPMRPPSSFLRKTLPWAAAIAVSFAAGAAFDRSRNPPATASVIRALTFSGRDWSPAASPDGKTIAFASDRDGRSRIWLKQLATGNEAALTGGPDDFPRFSPDGSTVLFVRDEGGHQSLYRVALLGGEPRKLIDDVTHAGWSPDGKQVVFVRVKTKGAGQTWVIAVATADGGEAHEIAAFEGTPVRHPRWSPDGRLIAANIIEIGNFAEGRVLVLGAEGKDERRITTLGGREVMSSLSWSGAEELLYAQREPGATGALSLDAARIIQHNIRTGEAKAILRTTNGGGLLDILGSGRLIFSGGASRETLREVRLARGSGPESRWLTRGSAIDRQPAFSPDGEWVIFASGRSGNRDLWEVSTRSGVVKRLTDQEEVDQDPDFTRDGRRLLWASRRSGHTEIWMAEPDGSGAQQVTHDVNAQNPTATPDGHWIVYASGNPDHPGVWKINPDGTKATQLVAGNTALPETSPDGQYAAYCWMRNSPRPSIRVVRIADGAAVPFEIPISFRRAMTLALLGRVRWMPDGHALAFVGQDENGVTGIYVQDFVPGRDTTATRRRLAGFDPDHITESFGIAPDGSRLVLAEWDQVFSIMLAEGVPGVAPPERRER